MGATDFSLCMYQIPEKYHKNLEGVVNLAQQLEMAKFKNFWKETESVTFDLESVHDWRGAVRNFIAGVVSSTYRSIKIDQLAELLNLPVDDMPPVIKERGWRLSKE